MTKQTLRASNNWLSRFEISLTSLSALLYPNARQQVLVTLIIAPRTGQTISDDELESVCITTRKNELFPILPGGDDGSEWFYSQTKNQYLPYPASAVSPPLTQKEPENVNFFQKDFYILSRAPTGASVRLYVSDPPCPHSKQPVEA